MCFENNNLLFTLVVRCARIDKQLSTKEEVTTRLKIKWGTIFKKFLPVN
jgi:hypothetical protein